MKTMEKQIEMSDPFTEINRLRCERDELRSELDTQRQRAETFWRFIVKLTDDNVRQRAELAKAREALTFYRDGFRYHPKRSRTGVNLSEWRPTEGLLADCGERARAALQPEEPKSIVDDAGNTGWIIP